MYAFYVYSHLFTKPEILSQILAGIYSKIDAKLAKLSVAFAPQNAVLILITGEQKKINLQIHFEFHGLASSQVKTIFIPLTTFKFAHYRHK